MASNQQQQDDRPTPFFHPSYSQPPIDRSIIPSPFRIDEGFSEDTQAESELVSFEPHQTLPESNSGTLSPDISALRQWMLAQPVQFRAAVARDLLASVPTSLLSALVNEANARLHLDPIRCLPKEIILQILECLDSSALFQAALVSRLWVRHATEPFLWKRLFALEGWNHNALNITSFEQSYLSQIHSFSSLHSLGHPPLTDSETSPPRRSLRPFAQGISTEGTEQGDISRLWVKDGVIELPSTWPPPRSRSVSPSAPHHTTNNTIPSFNTRPSARSFDSDEVMLDAPEVESLDPGAGDSDFAVADVSSLNPGIPVCPLIFPPYLTDALDPKPQPNWKYLYKQRRRLEQNWIDGRFTPFRLPHPNYPDDAHRQCVYTLQFSPKYVVSGSRDKSVRVWDLGTQRLKMAPLLGHDGSVLCVQFDARPDRDVIISGSSDADVIVWRFSTGGMIKRLRQAHNESVLNLRFDDRYLVTCSKDKTIKLWNRKELLPTDPEYPQTNRSPNATYPQYIVDIKEMFSKPRAAFSTPLMPYTLLTTFNEHGAAVNAIQIHGNEIVSASGDRKIALWHIPSGRLTRIFLGHNKGIACVQYDGRRIISGSSDNSVRIFDSATSAEVAVLDGHKDLVRTIQADFGDAAGDDGLLEAQARQNDEQVLQNKRMELEAQVHHDDEQVLQDQSTELDDEQAPEMNGPWVLGAKIPPNGGGSKWSKIVSGSYDETVIIWRKNKDGQWIAAKKLRQDDAIKATAPEGNGPDSSTTTFAIHNGGIKTFGIGNTLPFAMTLPVEQIFQKAKEVGMPARLSGRGSLLWIRRNLLIGRPARQGVIQFYKILGTSSATSQQPANLTSGNPSQTLFANLPGPVPAHLHPNHPHFQYIASSAHSVGRGLVNRPDIFHHVARQLMDPHIQLYFQQQLTRTLFAASFELQQNAGRTAPNTTPSSGEEAQDGAVAATASAGSENPTDGQGLEQTNNDTTQSTSRAFQTELDTTPPTLPTTNAPRSQESPAAAGVQHQTSPHVNNPNDANEAQPSTTQPRRPSQSNNPPIHTEPGFSRVFKLQFDSRRIICCSQQPIMVGWDFASGDRDIEEASQFFD